MIPPERLELSLTDARLTAREIEGAIRAAAGRGAAGAVVLPESVSEARAALSGLGHPFALYAAVDWPLGTAIAEVKVREARAVLEAGADGIEYVLDHRLVKEGVWPAVTQEMLSAAAFAKQSGAERVLRVVVEPSVLTHRELIAVAEAAQDVGVDALVLGAGRAGVQSGTAADVSAVLRVVGNFLTVKGMPADAAGARALLDAGAATLGVPNAGVFA